MARRVQCVGGSLDGRVFTVGDGVVGITTAQKETYAPDPMVTVKVDDAELWSLTQRKGSSNDEQ